MTPALFGAVTAAWVTIALLAVGLPLLAWWVGGRRVWNRLRPGAEPDPWREAVRRHGLSAAEAAGLARDVTRGREFDDPRLRRAAVDWAGTVLAQETPRPRTAVGRALVGLAIAWGLAVVGLVLYRVLTGRAEDVNWFSVLVYSLLAGWILRRRRGLRRTVAVNSGAADEGAG